MAEPNIVASRIDKKLVHRQGQLWIKALGVDTMIVTNGLTGENPMRQTLMKAVVPKTITMRFFFTRHTCDVITKASPKQTIFIVYRTTGDALKLVTGRVPVKEINVSNIHHALGREDVNKCIALGGDDETALRKMRDQYRATFSTETAVSGDDGAAKVDLSRYS